MIELEFNVKKQTMTRTDSEKVVSNSINIHQCHFTFSEDWANKEITAIFYKGRTPIAVPLDENNNCFIPSDCLRAFNNIVLKVGVFGVEGEEVITSTLVDIPVTVGSSTSGSSSEVTYNLYEQIMQKIGEIKKSEVSPETISDAVSNYLQEHPVSADIDVAQEVADYITANLEELKGEDGTNGKSAYQIAVDNGYSGTEEQWLASLKGADGTSYDDTEIKSEINDIWKANGENNLIVEAYNFGGTWRNSQYWLDTQETFNGYTVKRRNAAWNGLSKQVYVESGKNIYF